MNGAFRYNFTPNTSGVDILNFKFKNNTDPLNGVNVWDLSLISRHIQSIPAFTNPYQMLAADVNASGTITTFDIVQLRKLILGQFTNFGQISSLVDSWRFVPLNRFYNNVAAVDLFTYNPFTVTTLGAPYPYYLNQVSFGTTNSPFTADHLYRASAVAVKMGDVNFESGQLACEALTGSVDDRTIVNQIVTHNGNSSMIPAGTPISIRLSTVDISDIASWQAGIRYNSDKLKVTGVFSTVFEQFDENAWSINNDEIRMVWLHDHALLEDVKNGETFVEIQGQTRCDVKADEMLIHFDNEILPFLLFGSQGEVLSIQFDYEILSKAVNSKEQIASAFPAPFNDYFTIQIPEIEDNSEVDFQLSGLDGVAIMKEQVVFQNGLATIRPDNISTLPGGIYVATILHKNG